jgi:pyrroline-5-carboxylate reductase
MADALLSGLLEKKTFAQKNIIVSDVSKKRLDFMNAKYGIMTTTSNSEVLTKNDIILLAVKPQIIDQVLGDLKSKI